MSTKKIQDSSASTPTHHIDRRSALKGIASVSAVSALGISFIPAGCTISDTSGESSSKAATDTQHMHSLVYDEWNKYVGTRFEIRGSAFDKSKAGSVTAALRLEKVLDQDHDSAEHPRPSELRPTTVSLLFSSEDAIPNMTYDVVHDELGTAHLFLHEVKVDAYPDQRIYEAVLN